MVTERDAASGPTLNLARPITIKEDACLTCHNTPWAAPAALIKSYGTVNGFGWKPNETIGAQLVSVPMAIPLGIARRTYVTFLIILIAIFAIIFAILNVFIALSGDYTDKAGVGDSRRGQLGGRRRRGLR